MSEKSEKRTFNFSSEASAEAISKQNEKKGGYGKNFKMKGRKAKLLVLPSLDPKEPIAFQAVVHQIWGTKDGQRRVVAEAASPSFHKEEDRIMVTGWNLKKKYDKSKNNKLKKAWQMWMPKRLHYINVLDLDDIAAGPQKYLCPASVYKVVTEEVVDLKENGKDLRSICDFKKGRPLIVKHNGEEKLEREYTVKFDAETIAAQDIEITEDDIELIASKMIKLSTLQPKYNEEAFEKVEQALEKMAQKMGIDLDGMGDEEDADEDEKSSGKSDLGDEDDDAISSVDDDDDEPVTKKNDKSSKSSKKSKDEEDEEFEEDDKPKSTKKGQESKKSKSDDDDDDNFDVGDDEEDDDEPKSRKVASRGRRG